MKQRIVMLSLLIVLGGFVTAAPRISSIVTENTEAVDQESEGALSASGTVTASLNDDKEYQEAVARMYSKGMTKFTDVEQFDGEQGVTREQAAKFFAQFAKEVLYSTLDMAKYCRFGDLEEADPSLKNYILEACLFSLFQGSSGKFSPKQGMTKDQVIAVLMRATEGGFADERTDPRRKNYYTIAFEKGITKETDLTKFSVPVSRYELALLLRRAAMSLEKEAVVITD